MTSARYNGKYGGMIRIAEIEAIGDAEDTSDISVLRYLRRVGHLVSIRQVFNAPGDLGSRMVKEIREQIYVRFLRFADAELRKVYVFTSSSARINECVNLILRNAVRFFVVSLIFLFNSN